MYHCITGVFFFDLDAGTVDVCENRYGAFSEYDLHDVSVAAYKAQRSGYCSFDSRQVIFESALEGKEIVSDTEMEHDSHTMQI